MSHEQTIRDVRDTLCSVFAQVDAWFEQDETMRRFKPESGGWSVDQVLEHIALTNRFLMLKLGKWITIAEQRACRRDPVPDGESDLDRLQIIGERGSFGWVRPEHMEPTGAPTTSEVRATLRQQLGECLINLERMGKGVGALCTVRMTVNNLGKIDLYQWLYFLAQHARRHVQQLLAIEAEVHVKTGCSGPFPDPPVPDLDDEGRPVPPWIKYPNLRRGSMGWRMGAGESYLWNLFRRWWRELSESQRQIYRSVYPSPKEWNGFLDSAVPDTDSRGRLVPPWIKHPKWRRDSFKWRISRYKRRFSSWWETLPHQDREEYLSQYPSPINGEDFLVKQ